MLRSAATSPRSKLEKRQLDVGPIPEARLTPPTKFPFMHGGAATRQHKQGSNAGKWFAVLWHKRNYLENLQVRATLSADTSSSMLAPEVSSRTCPMWWHVLSVYRRISHGFPFGWRLRCQ